jgi:hypothetical protein
MAGEALDHALAAFGPAADPTTADVLAVVVAAFNSDTGGTLEARQLSSADRRRLRDWLTILAMSDASSGAGTLVRARSRIDHFPLYADTASKIGWLTQHPCYVCSGERGPRTLPVEIEPWSHQASRPTAAHLHARILDLIARNPAYRDTFDPLPSNVQVCLRFVFVLANKVSMKDCDNLAKGLLDAFEGILYENDRQVAHLDVYRLEKSGAMTGHVMVRCASTTVNNHTDVIDPQHARIAFLTADDLR